MQGPSGSTAGGADAVYAGRSGDRRAVGSCPSSSVFHTSRLDCSSRGTAGTAAPAGASYLRPISGHPGALRTATTAAAQESRHPATATHGQAVPTDPAWVCSRWSRVLQTLGTGAIEANAATTQIARRNQPRVTRRTPHDASATRASAVVAGLSRLTPTAVMGSPP